LVASKEETEVAKVVEKALKNASPVRYTPTQEVVEGVHNPNVREPLSSVNACGQFGHIAMFCVKKT